jgi:hypothetical protein
VILRTLTIVSLVTAVATLGLGVVSYWRGIPGNTLWIDGVEEKPRLRWAVISGTIHAVYSEPGKALPGMYDLNLGAFYVRRASIGNVEAKGLGVQWWALFPLLMILPTGAFVRGPMRRWRRRRRGLCVECGYNLTGLTEARCPECGRAFTRVIAG